MALDFDQLFRSYHSDMIRYARHRIGGPHDTVEDVVATVWLKAWEQRAEFDERTGSPKGWLINLTAWECLGIIRDRQTHPFRPIPEDWDAAAPDRDAAPYPGLTDPITHRAWAEVQCILGEQQALAVWLRHIGGYSTAEAAQIMGLSPDMLRVVACRGLTKIEEYFQGAFVFRQGCRNCGWNRGSLGHRMACLSGQQDPIVRTPVRTST